MDKFASFHAEYLALQRAYGIEVTIDKDEHWELNSEGEWELYSSEVFLTYTDTETGDVKRLYEDGTLY